MLILREATVNKLCDAADWFRPEIDRIIREELEDVSRYHRKQWEFAFLFRALEEYGLLDGQSSGISFGSGTELVLYAVARRVRHIWATDLYTSTSAWDIARTEDAMDLVRSRAPFAFPEGAISAKNMDMRKIEFPDESFDFGYSSCAIEHIGQKDDFIDHLREVKRVLKPGGIYAFTTELNYSDRAVEHVGSFFFSRNLLEEIVRQSGMESDSDFDASLWENRINTPLPLSLHYGLNDGEGRFNEKLFGTLCHVQLSTANLALTSCIVVLRKSERSFVKWNFQHWDNTRKFVDQGLDLIRAMVEESELSLHPFAWMPNRRSLHYIGHADYSKSGPVDSSVGTLFHSPYVWLGRRPRLIRISLVLETRSNCLIRLKIHKSDAYTPWLVELHASLDVDGAENSIRREIDIHPDDECTYAVLAEVVLGDVMLKDVQILCLAAGGRRTRLDESEYEPSLR